MIIKISVNILETNNGFVAKWRSVKDATGYGATTESAIENLFEMVVNTFRERSKKVLKELKEKGQEFKVREYNLIRTE